MELDIKNLEQQDAKALVKSLELVSARLLESITKASQVACFASPETRLMFDRWVSLVSDDILEAAKNGEIKPDELAEGMGVSPETVLSLLFALQRQGRLRIRSVEAQVTNGENKEICGCLK